jgi:hypothetical protein
MQESAQTIPNMSSIHVEILTSNIEEADWRDTFRNELQTMIDICDFHISHRQIDYTNLSDIIDKLTFTKLVEEVAAKCPVTYSILEIFVRSSEKRIIKTAAEKILRMMHAIGCLLRLRSERSSSLPHLFGLLLMGYGCGQGNYLQYLYFIEQSTL